jgi:6-pyruvoyltetrahydropterin/6-carboxytetrahydropterin synthase
VAVRIVAPVDDNGLTGDYAVYKNQIKKLCDSLDEYTLIPSQSPYLSVKEDAGYYRVTHDGDTLILLKTDTLIIPVRNPPVADLSQFLLETLVEDREFLRRQDIREIEVMVSSGPGQTGSSFYEIDAG